MSEDGSFEDGRVVVEDTPEPAHDAGDGAPRRRNWRRLAMAGAFAALVLGSLQAAVFVKDARTKLSADAVGESAPDFTLRTLTGDEEIALSSLRGRPVVVNFFASWCHTCKQEAPVLAEGWRKWQSTGVQFLGVDSRDSKRWGLEFESKYGVEYPTLFDGPGRVMDRYGATGHPETFFIDADGRIRAKFVGPLDTATLDRLLLELVGRSYDAPESGTS